VTTFNWHSPHLRFGPFCLPVFHLSLDSWASNRFASLTVALHPSLLQCLTSARNACKFTAEQSGWALSAKVCHFLADLVSWGCLAKLWKHTYRWVWYKWTWCKTILFASVHTCCCSIPRAGHIAFILQYVTTVTSVISVHAHNDGLS
jgi:hypothetical protein